MLYFFRARASVRPPSPAPMMATELIEGASDDCGCVGGDILRLAAGSYNNLIWDSSMVNNLICGEFL